jgi:NAD(P)H dehydrogenase (quinone)
LQNFGAVVDDPVARAALAPADIIIIDRAQPPPRIVRAGPPWSLFSPEQHIVARQERRYVRERQYVLLTARPSRRARPAKEIVVPKVLVLYYSAYGHIERMAEAVAEGAREAGAKVDIKRVPELVPAEVAKVSHYKLNQAAPVAAVADLADYDAIIVGTGTRFGRVSSQMANFLDQAGTLWMRGTLHGKVGGAFSSSATQHGGQEMTLFSIIANMMHLGMIIVGLDYGHAGQMTLSEVTGGSPYGATTISGADGSRQPTDNELNGARYQGRKIAETAKKLFG